MATQSLARCLVPLLLAACGTPTPTSTWSGPPPDWVDELAPQARTVVSERYGEVMACSAEVGAVTGEVKVMIGTQNGRVKTWAVLTNETGEPKMAECVLGKVRKWGFPKGFDDSLKLPFAFGGD